MLIGLLDLGRGSALEVEGWVGPPKPQLLSLGSISLVLASVQLSFSLIKIYSFGPKLLITIWFLKIKLKILLPP